MRCNVWCHSLSLTFSFGFLAGPVGAAVSKEFCSTWVARPSPGSSHTFKLSISNHVSVISFSGKGNVG